MELRTIAILLLMATIVVLTAAFGTYQDGIDKQKEHEFQIKRKEERAAEGAGDRERPSQCSWCFRSSDIL